MVIPQDLQTKGRIIEFEVSDFNDNPDDFDDNEQNLDHEAQRMMLSWDRENLLQEISELEDKDEEGAGAYQYYDGTESFDDLKESMEALEGNFVWIKRIESNPKGKRVMPTYTVLVDYVGFLEYNPEPFESTIHDGKPKLLKLSGDDSVIIAGFIQALISLNEGERANVLIHPALGYREYGAYPIIPKDSFLYYNVKVHKVWEEGNFDGVLQWERHAHIMIPLQDKIKLATEHKDVANQYLSDDKPKEALVRYKAAIKWLSETPQEDVSRSPECQELMQILWQNIAITTNKLGMHKSASKAAKQALSFNPNNVKALYQLAKARIALADHERALHVLERAERVAPKDPHLLSLRLQIDANLKPEKEKRDEILLKMAKSLV